MSNTSISAVRFSETRIAEPANDQGEMRMEEEREFFLRSSKTFSGYLGIEGGELQSFRSCLKWVCVDQSNLWKTGLSWSIFFVLAIGVPILTHFLLSCSSCDDKHVRPYDAIIQLSLSSLAALSFVSLSALVKKYGLRKSLFLDKLSDSSDKVRDGYTGQLHRSMKLLSLFVLPCFALEIAYKVWWYISGGTEIPYFGSIYLSHAIACTLELCSWLYRTAIFLLVCILFRLICHMQILKLEDFAQVFQKESDVGSVLKDHLRIRRNLKIISHRFRVFILSSLILVTASQLASLLLTTRSSAKTTIYKAGELALCSINLVTGLGICLRSATKITHKAQSVTCLAAKWHVCATIDTFDVTDGETPTIHAASAQVFPANWGSDDEEGDGDDVLDNTNLIPVYARSISFQKRQAFVTYLENNRAGITVFGFMLDRTWLHTIFGVEMSLVLWLLSKTIAWKFKKA